MVWSGPVGPGGHDGLEADIVGPVATHGGIEFQTEGHLGGPSGQHRSNLGQSDVGDGRRRRDPIDLTVVLEQA